MLRFALASSTVTCPTPTPAATPPPPCSSALPANLDPTGLIWFIVIALAVVAVFVIVNTIVNAKFYGTKGKIPLPSVVRAWIAIALVVGLVVYTGATLGGNDQSLRSSLVGGLVAAVGSATAFYFATKSADAAINAVAGAGTVATAKVPTLTGLPLSEALALVGATNFKLVVDASTVDGAASPQTVAHQDQEAGTRISMNSVIVVTLAHS